MEAFKLMSHAQYTPFALFCVVLVLFQTQLGDARGIRNHAEYIQYRTESGMLLDGLRVQESVIMDTLLPQLHLPDHSNQTVIAIYLKAVKQVLKLKSLLGNTLNSSELVIDPNLQLILNRVMDDACCWLMSVLPSDFNCTSLEHVEALYTKIDLHNQIQDTRIAVHNLTENESRYLDCSWINYRVLDDCDSNSNLTCTQESVKAYFTADNGLCSPSMLGLFRTEFYLCQDH